MPAFGPWDKEIWRYPVKPLSGDQVAASVVDARGLLGDRVWAVIDTDHKLGSGKNTRPAGTSPAAE